MPKLPVIKASKLLRALKKLGFNKYHQVGSHVQLKHPDSRRTTLHIIQQKKFEGGR